MTPSAFAALTKLADEPLNVKNSAEPNIVLTLDDSTSMLSDFLPELVVDNYCRDGNGVLQAACGRRPASAADDYPAFIYHQNGVPYNAYDTGAGRTPVPPFNAPNVPTTAQQWPAVAHNAAFNRLYYNPRITYEPPANPDGTSWPSMNSANTTAWTRVPADPFKTPAAPLTATPLVNLTSSVSVGFWCNTDWTQGGSPVPLQNDPAYCRTNGSGASSVAITGPAYAASLMGPRPGAAYAGNASDGDYVLPWPKPGAAANDAKYYSRTGTNSLWCNTASPYWPQSCVNTTCRTFGTPVAADLQCGRGGQPDVQPAGESQQLLVLAPALHSVRVQSGLRRHRMPVLRRGQDRAVPGRVPMLQHRRRLHARNRSDRVPAAGRRLPVLEHGQFLHAGDGGHRVPRGYPLHSVEPVLHPGGQCELHDQHEGRQPGEDAAPGCRYAWARSAGTTTAAAATRRVAGTSRPASTPGR